MFVRHDQFAIRVAVACAAHHSVQRQQSTQTGVIVEMAQAISHWRASEPIAEHIAVDVLPPLILKEVLEVAQTTLLERIIVDPPVPQAVEKLRAGADRCFRGLHGAHRRAERW